MQLHTIRVTEKGGAVKTKVFGLKTEKKFRGRYMTKMLNKVKNSHIDITPRDFSIRKLKLEANKGAYDYRKARRILGI